MGDIEKFEEMLEDNNIREQTNGSCIPSSTSVSSLAAIVNYFCHEFFNAIDWRCMREIAL